MAVVSVGNMKTFHSHRTAGPTTWDWNEKVCAGREQPRERECHSGKQTAAAAISLANKADSTPWNDASWTRRDVNADYSPKANKCYKTRYYVTLGTPRG